MPPVDMTAATVLRRARSRLGQKTVYFLGAGGMDPARPSPGSRCDCSGFVAWCYGVSRRLTVPWYVKENGGWFETTALVRDAKGPFGFVDRIGQSEARPGDLVVYGDRAGRQGHVGILTTVILPNGAGRVIHCSKSGWVVHGDAIRETDLEPAFPVTNRIFAMLAWVTGRDGGTEK